MQRSSSIKETMVTLMSTGKFRKSFDDFKRNIMGNLLIHIKK